MNGICECGCGGKTNPVPQTDTSKGYKLGGYYRFIRLHHMRVPGLKPDNAGENNPMYKGNKVGYGGVHAWVRARKTKPALCEKCNVRPAVDLANISGKYSRDLSDWEYLCRKCHMDSDGRNERLRLSGKSRKFPDINCLMCDILFHPEKRNSKFCSRSCYFKYRVKIGGGLK